jgi:hypothetical protein
VKSQNEFKILGWSGILPSLATKMLLNEFLEEHRKVEEQGAIIAKQQRQIKAFTVGRQKVTDQLAAASPSDGGLEASNLSRTSL